MHGSLCVCALVPRLETRTRLVLFIHRFEYRKPTNTGLLAASCVAGSQVHVRGGESDETVPFVRPEGSRALVLFPYEDATPLDRLEPSEAPVTLVVPDGSWRQAWKMYKRVPGLEGLPCVSLPDGPRSTYRLRSESHAAGLSTLEAIARALGILEGPEVQSAIERVFLAMVERTLWARGIIPRSEVTTGIPEGARRHDPRRAGGDTSVDHE
jgi:DTW domain-containing protein YfiP